MLLTLISQALKIIVCAEGVDIGLEVEEVCTKKSQLPVSCKGVSEVSLSVLMRLQCSCMDQTDFKVSLLLRPRGSLMYFLNRKIVPMAEAGLATRLPVRRSCRKTHASS